VTMHSCYPSIVTSDAAVRPVRSAELLARMEESLGTRDCACETVA
jgi:hypothetical protein